MQKWNLFRDGNLVMTGTGMEILEYVLKKHSFSLSWAVQHEGYRVEAVRE
jgi:hypothetical protein